MKSEQIETAKKCLEAAENDTMAFPQIVGTLIEAGFESYTIDFRLSRAFYFLANGEVVIFDTHKISTSVGASFNKAAIKAAILEAQTQVYGYTYKGFCEKAAAAGCVGYMVSFLGKRAVYIGRTGDTHVEEFPK